MGLHIWNIVGGEGGGGLIIGRNFASESWGAYLAGCYVMFPEYEHRR